MPLLLLLLLLLLLVVVYLLQLLLLMALPLLALPAPLPPSSVTRMSVALSSSSAARLPVLPWLSPSPESFIPPPAPPPGRWCDFFTLLASP